MEQVQEQLINLFTILISGVLTLAAVYATIYINKLIETAKLKNESIQDENARKKMNTALDRVDSLLVTNITNAEVTLKKELIEGIQDGKLTKEDFASLKESVVNNVLKQLGTNSTELLSTEIGDLNDYVSVKLEETLANLKEDSSSVVQHTNL